MCAAAEEFLCLLRGEGVVEGAERIARYLALVERWSSTHSLVRARSRTELVRRHAVESLAALPYLEATGVLLDVGSGAGLPGVPILAARPGWRGQLLEPRQKRWAFLRRVVRELELEAEVKAVRYQDLGEGVVGLDLVTARALGGYPDLLAWARPRLAPDGRVFLWTGPETAESLARLPGWDVLSSPLSCAGHSRLIRLRPCFT